MTASGIISGLLRRPLRGRERPHGLVVLSNGDNSRRRLFSCAMARATSAGPVASPRLPTVPDPSAGFDSSASCLFSATWNLNYLVAALPSRPGSSTGR